MVESGARTTGGSRGTHRLRDGGAMRFSGGDQGRPMTEVFSRIVDEAWERRNTLDPFAESAVRDAVDHALDGLDNGRFRVAEKFGNEWHVHQWLKKAVLLSFRFNPLRAITGGPAGAHWW